MPEAPSLSITELSAFRKEVKKQEQVLKEKRARVEAFQGLPPVRSFNSLPTIILTLLKEYRTREACSAGSERQTNGIDTTQGKIPWEDGRWCELGGYQSPR